MGYAEFEPTNHFSARFSVFASGDVIVVVRGVCLGGLPNSYRWEPLDGFD